jgi:dipeptidase
MKNLLVYICLAFVVISYHSHACTTMIITKGASADGTTIVAHSDDNEMQDERVVLIPAQDHATGAKRPVYVAKGYYPRFVGTDRGPAYDTPGLPKSKPIGYIDQVKHTYSYIEGSYGIINEHQLALGECTNSVYYYYASYSKDRLLCIAELSQIALERCTNARDAIKLMGSLAEEHGYYSWGETLLVCDTDEGWVFEISCTPNGKGAMWVAKKVPDGEVFVAANQFRIQDVIKDDDDMMFSSNLFDIAIKEKKWKEGEKLNWLKLACPGEFDHPYYSLRRVWRVFDRVAPALKLSPWVEDAFTTYYPFSIKPDKKITVRDVMSLYRDYYQDTPFDMRKGIAAGPYGSPHRYLSGYDRCNFPNKRKTKLKGAWERSISVYYTGYTYITQLRKDMPDAIGGITWVGFDEAFTTCFMPLYAGVNATPSSFSVGSPNVFNKNFAWWAFNMPAQWIDKNYKDGVKDIVKRQKYWEDKQFANQAEIEKQAMKIYNKGKNNDKELKDFLTHVCAKNSSKVIASWWDLSRYIIEKYNEGYINKPHMAETVGYPQWWLDDTGYKDGPIEYSEEDNKFNGIVNKIFKRSSKQKDD